MNNKIKMSDTWGWGCVPQDFTKFNGFKHDNGDYNGDCYGLIFLTKEAAEAQAHALRNHDRLVEENKRLREVVLYLVHPRQHSEINSYYTLEALASLAVRTLSELDGEK